LPYRLLALDVDGTLVDGSLQITLRTRQAIGAAIAGGVHVTLASGRLFHQVRVFAKDLGIREPLICNQGALVIDPLSSELLYECTVPRPVADEFMTYVLAQGWDLCVYAREHLYAHALTPEVQVLIDLAPAGQEVRWLADLDESVELVQLLVIVQPERAALVERSLKERFGPRLSVVRSFSHFVEASNPAVSKGKGLAFLAERLGVSRAETMAIGDQDNDVAMIAWAGLGVAMGNASAACKAAADYVTADVSADGAAWAIERFVLGQHHA
jgi:hypothetical protein